MGRRGPYGHGWDGTSAWLRCQAGAWRARAGSLSGLLFLPCAGFFQLVDRFVEALAGGDDGGIQLLDLLVALGDRFVAGLQSILPLLDLGLGFEDAGVEGGDFGGFRLQILGIRLGILADGVDRSLEALDVFLELVCL